jgi:ribosomal RNA-processing protein 9
MMISVSREGASTEAKVKLLICLLPYIDPDDADAAEADRQNISARLQADVSSQSSHIHTFVADKLILPHSGDTSNLLACRGHNLTVTSALVDANCKSMWTAGKDGQVIRWRVRDGKMLEIISKASSGEVSHHHRKKNTSSTSGAARRKARAALVASSSGKINNVDGKEIAAGNENHLNGHSEAHCHRTVPLEGQGHSDEVWALTTSSDGKYLVSGGKDKRICVWSLDGASTTFTKTLGGHKDSITALRFRIGSHDLFSASLDRTLKLFDVSQLSYVETFFGHQEEVASFDLLRGEVAVSAGSRDRTVRWWKVRDESQLVFRGGAKSKVREILEGGDLYDEEEGGNKKGAVVEEWVEGSIDAVAMVDEHTFLSGGDSGTISLWSLSKKKPIFTVAVAHGYHRTETQTEGTIQSPRWITSLACLPYGDVFASGSWDGQIRLWRLSSSLRTFSFLYQVPVEGFINSLQLVMPSRSVLKKQGAVVEQEAWRRKGGLTGGVKKVFDEVTEETHQEGQNGTTPTTNGTSTPSSVLLLAAGVGQEPTRGRWMRIKEAKNGAILLPIPIG